MTPGPPLLSVVRTEAVAVVRLGGDIDIATAGELETAVLEQVEGARAVVVDLSAVGFLDSAGLRLLDRLVADCDRRHRPMRVVAPVGSPARLPIDLCGMREGLVASSSAAALAGLGGSRPG